MKLKVDYFHLLNSEARLEFLVVKNFVLGLDAFISSTKGVPSFSKVVFRMAEFLRLVELITLLLYAVLYLDIKSLFYYYFLVLADYYNTDELMFIDP